MEIHGGYIYDKKKEKIDSINNHFNYLKLQ